MEKENIKDFINSVIKKKFEKKEKGYSPLEVDQTLDEIFKNFSRYIDDYEKLSKKYYQLEEEHGALITHCEMIEKQNKMFQEEIHRFESSGASMNMLKMKMDELEGKIEKSKPTKAVTKKVQD